MTQSPTLPQNIAVSQLEQPVPLLPRPWMDAPHPPTYGVVLLGLISMAIFIGGFAADTQYYVARAQFLYLLSHS